MAQELCFEDPPPFPTIVARPPADKSSQPQPFLCDERWAEAAQNRIIEVDSYEERRKRLLKPRVTVPPPVKEGDAEEVQRPRGNRKAKAKAKGAE